MMVESMVSLLMVLSCTVSLVVKSPRVPMVVGRSLRLGLGWAALRFGSGCGGLGGRASRRRLLRIRLCVLLGWRGRQSGSRFRKWFGFGCRRLRRTWPRVWSLGLGFRCTLVVVLCAVVACPFF